MDRQRSSVVPSRRPGGRNRSGPAYRSPALREGTQRGSTLLEVLCALAIVGTAGAATIWELTTALSEGRRAREEEHHVETAHRVLTAVTLLRRAELDRRLGTRSVGEFLVTIQRVDSLLYRITVADVMVADRAMLATLVYRSGVEP